MSCPEQLLKNDIKLNLTTKSQIDIRRPEPKHSDANSRSFNVQPHLPQYFTCIPDCVSELHHTIAYQRAVAEMANHYELLLQRFQVFY